MHNVALEKVDANMEEATVGAWLVAVGDSVAAGQPFVELITDKVTFQWESPVGGTVRALIAGVGSLVPVGYVIAQIGADDEDLPDVAAHNARLAEEHKRRHDVQIDTSGAGAARSAASAGRVRATPAARRLAREHDLDLAAVTPAEPGGIVGEEDVKAHLATRGGA
jgi:pyruvate/2-oxoglutarate dehydrogenase complex dihydrolipoamide acyltransferase (E2) component